MTDSKPTETIVSRIARELAEAKTLAFSKPWLFAALIAVAIIVAYVAYRQYWDIPGLKRSIEQLKHEKEQLQAELETERHKYSSLELQFNPFKTAAILKYGSDTAAIAKLAEDLKKIDTSLRIADTKIKYLSVLVETEFTTDWQGGTIPNPQHWVHTGGGAGEVETTLELNDGRKIAVLFGPSDSIKIDRLEAGYVRLSYRATAAAGSNIFGELPESISKVVNFKFPTYGTQDSSSKRVLFRNVRMQFFVNGAACFNAHVDIGGQLDVNGNGYLVSTIVQPLSVEFVKSGTAAGE